MDANKELVVDMQQHFDVDDAMDDLIQKRFSMPPAVVATFRQAAAVGAMRLLQLVNDDAKFGKMRPADQVRVLELIFDRAYGKSETASNHDLTQVKVGGNSTKSKHSESLDQIAMRAAARKAIPNYDDLSEDEAREAEAAVASGGDIGSLDAFPELRQRARAANVVRLPRRPL